MTDAESDKQAHAEIAKANAAMPQRMSDREFRERVMRLANNDDTDQKIAVGLALLLCEWRRRNG